jgi:hypothetical protein
VFPPGMATQLHKLQLPQDEDAWKLFVFRKSRAAAAARSLIEDLHKEIEALINGDHCVLDALVRAGELETAFADIGSPAESTLATITDGLAARACDQPSDLEPLLGLLDRIQAVGHVLCSHPEGFSYYGLNPLDFAVITTHLQPHLGLHAAVIGIRSVGSTLGAVVAAVLRAGNLTVERITVRPEGEPYKRSMNFRQRQLDWIKGRLQVGAEFLIVDEGPGFSGSTLLSVAQGCEKAGVPRDRITLICSRPIDDRFTHGGWDELKNYRCLVSGYGKRIPAEADRQAGAGVWREMLYADASDWPACWTDLERIKHLSVEGAALFKFEGLGRFGALARRQAQMLADAAFSPALLGFEDGFARYRFEEARPLNRQDLTWDLLTQMAEYCAFRARNLAAAFATPESLLNMMQVNLKVEFDRDNPFSDLPIAAPVYPDCRMMPYEWILTRDGRILKTDSVGHGEGHQIPGPADIAWDLAGVVVEWNLSHSEKQFFLAQYQRASGDDATFRINPYIASYLVYRAAYCRMGAACMRESGDGEALWKQYQEYRHKAKAVL